MILGVSLNSVIRWSDKGLIHSYRLNARGDRRFTREDVDEFLRKRRR